MERKKDTIRAKLYRFYGKNILSRIKNIRGATRFASILESLAEADLDQVDESKAKGIFFEHWDNLIVLDACRQDLYEEIRGKTKSRITLGSRTPEYIKRNFSEGVYEDIIYITANAQLSSYKFKKITGRNIKEVFFKVYHMWDTDWDSKAKTVMPSNIYKKAKKVEERYKKKRKIIHFMQPHIPFIGYKQKTDKKLDGIIINPKNPKVGRSRRLIWDLLEERKISLREFWKAYRQNLKVAMNFVVDLGEDLSGKTVLTSDHGNFVGENGLFKHPMESKARVLREVPWEVLNK